MLWAFVYLAAYAAVIWWLRDGGRTPIAAITCDRLGRLLGDLAGQLFALSLELQLGAAALIEKRRYV